MTTISNNLKRLMLDSGFTTTAELSKISGLSASTLNDLLSGRVSTPSSRTLKKLSSFFNVKFTEIIDEIPEPQGVFDSTSSLLHYLLKANFPSERELSRQINVSQNCINSILNGSTKTLTDSTVVKICNYFGISERQLLCLDPYQLVNESFELSTVKIPVITFEELLFLPDCLKTKSTINYLYLKTDQNNIAMIAPDNYCINKMSPLIKPDDTIILTLDTNAQYGETVFVLNDKMQIECGDFYKRRNETILCYANPSENYLVLNERKYKILAKIYEIKR